MLYNSENNNNEITFTSENLDAFLRELSKEYKKLAGKQMPAEIILVGGTAIIANYGFRDFTTDIDALISAASSMKDAIARVSNKFSLPANWLNDDFKKTNSYSPRLVEVSKHYRTYSNIVEVRSITGEYLVAMKLRSFRPYKKDKSDIIGILNMHEQCGAEITLDKIQSAAAKLYDGYQNFSKEAKIFIENALQKKNYSEAYLSIRKDEEEAKSLLLDFQKKYPTALNSDNVNDVIEALKRRKKEQTDRGI